MRESYNGFYARYIKRFLDIMCALAAITVFGWLFIIIAVMVKIKLGSPVIFKQARPGKNEKIFQLCKFRSMTNERDENGNLLPDEARLTKFGKFLRDTSLDELPEAWNILKGDMSVVGPRPLLVKDMVFMTSDQRKRHLIRPGLSGLAQVSGRNALAWDEKLKKDIEYIENVSFSFDLKIIWKTVLQVFFHKKGIKGNQVDEVEITLDYGDYLLEEGRINKEYYEEEIKSANEILTSGV